MRTGALDGAVLTSVGVAEIDKSVYAVSIPMAFDSYEEVYAVLDKMRPRLEASIEAQGLRRAELGRRRLGAASSRKKPVATPDDLKKLMLFQWEGDPKSLEIWQAAGFNPRAGASSELPTGLKTGIFEALSHARRRWRVITRYYENAKYMTDLNWALLLGATVIKKDAWDADPRRHPARAAEGRAGRRREAAGRHPEERRDQTWRR